MQNMYVVTFVLFYLALVVEGRNSCSSSKLAAKYVETFTSLQSDGVLVEAKFHSQDGESYRFVASETWKTNNGELNYMDEILVNLGTVRDSSVGLCFDELERKGYYLLALRRGDGFFVPILSPLSIKKHSRRQELRTAWCDLAGNDCTLQISRDILPALVELFPGTNTLLKCRVSSKTGITSIRWLRNGKDIVEYGGDLYAENGVYVLGENLQKGTSELVIYRSTRMHSGVYACVASNEGGESIELKTRVSVGPESSLFGECPTWAAGYCHADSVCRGIVDLPNEVVCECKGGRTGARCHEVVTPDLEPVTNDKTKCANEIHELQITNILLAVALIISVFLLVFVTISMLRRRRNRRLSHCVESPNEKTDSLRKAESGIPTHNT